MKQYGISIQNDKFWLYRFFCSYSLLLLIVFTDFIRTTLLIRSSIIEINFDYDAIKIAEVFLLSNKYFFLWTNGENRRKFHWRSCKLKYFDWKILKNKLYISPLFIFHALFWCDKILIILIFIFNVGDCL